MSPAALISIIDDDDAMRAGLVGLLRSCGYEARGFVSAEDFLGCGALQSFSCVITDIQMPGMSGIELQRRLVAQRYSRPVVMITALEEPGLEERALASGAACFLKKPLDSNALLDCVERLVSS